MPYTTSFLDSYNFDAAFRLTVEERFQVCIDHVDKRHRESGYSNLARVVPIPPSGLSAQEIGLQEQQFDRRVPGEYAQFLRRWSYLDIGDGLNIWGGSYNGVNIGRPWISAEHNAPHEYLVFGDYWNYADGDQLMFDLNEPDFPVVLYLHEEALIEYFAPSFSLALWRAVDECLNGEGD